MNWKAALAVPIAAITLVTGWEGLKTTGYLDVAGIPTIGYGHTGPEVRVGQKITKEQADALLQKDLQEAAMCVDKTPAKLSEDQRAALISFVYNLGCTKYTKSTLRKLTVAGQCQAAANEFGRWVYADGRIVRGLQNRRAAEAAVYRRGCVSTR